MSSEWAASSALTVAHAFPPRIRSIAERSSLIAPAGILPTMGYGKGGRGGISALVARGTA